MDRALRSSLPGSIINAWFRFAGLDDKGLSRALRSALGLIDLCVFGFFFLFLVFFPVFRFHQIIPIKSFLKTLIFFIIPKILDII